MKFHHLLLGLSAIALVTITVVLIWQGGSANQDALPILGAVPDFTLTERSGKSFSRAELDGKIWIADFIFTNCGGTCPIMTSAMAELQAALVEQKMEDVKLVSISVDPERDTPEVLSQFAKGYGAEPGRWHFLTGDGQAIQELANQGFHLAAATGIAEEEQIIHSNRFVLVDRQTRIRGYYDGTDEQAVQKLQQDLKKLYKARQPS
jgi:protein SCO1/2